MSLQGQKLHKLLAEYQAHCQAMQMSPKTMVNKRELFTRLIVWLGDRELNVETLREYIAKLLLTWRPNSVRTELRYIKAFVRWLVVEGHIDKDWAGRVQAPKVRLNDEDIPRAEVLERMIIAGTTPGIHDNKFHQQRKNDMRWAMLFMLRCGTRPSETKNLKTADLFLDAVDAYIYVVRKGGRQQRVALPDDKALIAELRKRQSTNADYLFSIDLTTTKKNLRNGAKKLGLKQFEKITLHKIRKVFITSSIRGGAALPVISKIAGHTDIGITQAIYSMYDLSDQRQAMNQNPVIKNQMNVEERLKEITKMIVQELGGDKRFVIKSENGKVSVDLNSR